jgi:hypothetical protein
MAPSLSPTRGSFSNPSWSSSSTSLLGLALCAGLGTLGLGCDGDAKKSESAAVGHVDRLAKLADADVEEIRRGLPVGAQKLQANLFDKEKEPFDPRVVRTAMQKTRESTKDLQLAKATFSAVLSPKGEAYASDQESDSLVSKNLFQAYPSIEGVQKGKYTEGFGDFADLRGARTGDDLQWVAATPIGSAEATKGYFVAGWSIRSFAYHLEQQLKSDLRNATTAADKKKEPPLLYVFVVSGGKAFGAPITPEVNRAAVEALQVLEKTPDANAAAVHGRVEIDNRSFGWASQRTKNLGEKTAIVVLRSEV